MEPAWLVDRLPMRLALVYGLGAMLVWVPLHGAEMSIEVETLSTRAIAAVVAGDDEGFALDRDGDIIRVARDGSRERTGSLGPLASPFGTAVDGHVVFGGITCDGPRCSHRVAQLAVLDEAGGGEASLILADSSGWPSPLSGLALVGIDGDTVWVNGAGTLFQVAVAPARIVARVPWPGGEPCVIGGVLHDLRASGGTYDTPGVDLAATTASFALHLRTWDGGGWRLVGGGSRSMPHGQNAYCSPSGYEIRDGGSTHARWAPDGHGWRTIDPVGVPQFGDLAPLTSSTRRRYTTTSTGALVDMTRPELPRPTGVTIPGFASSDMPPALQVDDAGGSLFWCATTYRAGSGHTLCGVGPAQTNSPQGPLPRMIPTLGPEPLAGAHHYNLCSAACGGGVRPHSRDLVLWFVGRHRPAGLSLNELCYDDYVYLAGQRLPGLDAGAGYTALATATGCPGAVKQFGNQVRVPSGGNTNSMWAQFTTQGIAPCDRRQHECRGAACAQADSGAAHSTYVFCSAHLESRRFGPSVAEIQAGEYLDLVTDSYGSDAARALAGDFNIARSDVDAWLAPRGYSAATTGPTISSHDPPASRQIDMIYFDDTAGRTGSAGTTYCDRQASDHCYVMASWPPGNRVS